MEYVHISAKEGYKNEALTHYEIGRPRYPVEVIRTVLNGLNSFQNGSMNNEAQPFRILELGAGTGKFTCDLIPELQSKNVELIVSEPLPAMYDKLKEILPGNVKVLPCAAQDIPMENESIDAILAAQAFHWFSDEKSLNEIARVLKRGGTMALLWLRADSSYSWVAEEKKIRSPYYEIDNTPWQESGQWKCDLEASQLFSLREKIIKDIAPQMMNIDSLVHRFLSVSVIAKRSSEEKEKIAEEYRNMLTNHPDLKGKETICRPQFALICWCNKI